MQVLDRLIYNSLTIEVTRRCNMSCKHCLRGNAQNKDISLNSIDLLLSKLRGKCFKSISFTGGESSLNVKAIKYTLAKVKEYNISIWSFSLVTNGYQTTQEFIDVCNSWIDYCKINSGVYISKDSFHTNPTDNDLKLLSRLRCFKYWNIADKEILNLGNARDNGIGRLESISPINNTDFVFYKNVLIYTGKLILTCEDTIVTYCDYSYGEDEKRNILSDLDSFSSKLLFDRANKLSEIRPYFERSDIGLKEWIEFLESKSLI